MFQWKKKTTTQTPTGSLPNSDDELKSAARETVAAPPESKPVDFSENEHPEEKRPGFWSRWFAKTPEPEARFLIQPKWARDAVKLCFWPAVQYHHPAWALSDDEAEKARPEMQDLLQSLFDRYVPTVLNTWASRHSEFMNVLMAVGALYYYKYRMVRRILLEEEAARKVVEIRQPEQSAQPAGMHAPPFPNRPMLCAVCQTQFENPDAYNGHLVRTEERPEYHCPGKLPLQ
jgi:hypothetical protein